MTTEATSALAAGARPVRNQAEHLRRMCHELEATFLRQLFAAMREGIREEEDLPWDPPAGEEIFNAMLDDRLASAAVARMPRGLGETMYRQLVERLNLGVSTPGNELRTEE